MHLKAYKFRIYPTKDQEVLLAKTFGCCRFVWNKLVENFNNNSKGIINEKTLKDTPEFEFLKEVSASTLQQKRNDFIEFKKQFFNKKRKAKFGRPSFKKKSNRQSFRLPNQKFVLDQENGLVRLEKLVGLRLLLTRKFPKMLILGTSLFLKHQPENTSFQF